MICFICRVDFPKVNRLKQFRRTKPLHKILELNVTCSTLKDFLDLVNVVDFDYFLEFRLVERPNNVSLLKPFTFYAGCGVRGSCSVTVKISSVHPQSALTISFTSISLSLAEQHLQQHTGTLLARVPTWRVLLLLDFYDVRLFHVEKF